MGWPFGSDAFDQFMERSWVREHVLAVGAIQQEKIAVAVGCAKSLRGLPSISASISTGVCAASQSWVSCGDAGSTTPTCRCPRLAQRWSSIRLSPLRLRPVNTGFGLPVPGNRDAGQVISTWDPRHAAAMTHGILIGPGFKIPGRLS